MIAGKVRKVNMQIKIKTPPRIQTPNPGVGRKTTVRTLPRDPPGGGGDKNKLKSVLQYS